MRARPGRKILFFIISLINTYCPEKNHGIFVKTIF